MPKQQIKRPVVTLDTSNQLSLFAMNGEEEVEDKQAMQPELISTDSSGKRTVVDYFSCHWRRNYQFATDK